MVIMTMKTGPFAGQAREVSSIEPTDLLPECVKNGYHWEIDFSQATEDEMFLWGRADMVCRIILALMEWRKVTLDFPEGSKIYQIGRDNDVNDLAGIIEDVIVESGYNVLVVSDDDEGVVSGTEGAEHLEQ